jgi:tRNA threonylcarbamoyl adenosine modification protein YeaZ
VLLAIDTSSAATTVVVADSADVGSSATVVDNRRHAEVLAVLIEEQLRGRVARPADLERVVVGVGPGPFTGLRVGVVTALAWADALGVPIHAVMSLDIVAEQVRSGMARVVEPAVPLLVTGDARRREVFYAYYPEGATRAQAAVASMTTAVSQSAAQGARLVVGSGVELYGDALIDSGLMVGPALLPDASALARLALRRLAEDPSGSGFEPVVPQYLRRPDATVYMPAPRKRVSPA